MSSATILQFGRHEECSSLTRLATAAAPIELAGRSRNLKKHAELPLSVAPFDRIFRLETGRLTLAACDAAGRQVVMRSVTPGDFFGEYCFCAAQAEPHDYVAAKATEPSRVTE